MKTDRLYAITLYLMNHGKTSAAKLAEHFEVSPRTIQRDIDSLCCAGIPVIALPGAGGGYEIPQSFRLDGQLATKKDYSQILTALRGLSTATGDIRISNLCEKIIPLANGENTGMFLDFSVLREGNQEALHTLQSAISERHSVRFRYTSQKGETRIHNAEPIALLYRWYAWYLLAFSPHRQDYRTYKLLRMEQVEISRLPFTRAHPPAQAILAAHDQENPVQTTAVTVRCNPSVIARTAEYLNGKVLRRLDNGEALMELMVVENEQLWVGTLLSLGDQVEILSPAHIRKRVLSCAEKVVSLYEKT